MASVFPLSFVGFFLLNLKHSFLLLDIRHVIKLLLKHNIVVCEVGLSGLVMNDQECV